MLSEITSFAVPLQIYLEAYLRSLLLLRKNLWHRVSQFTRNTPPTQDSRTRGLEDQNATKNTEFPSCNP